MSTRRRRRASTEPSLSTSLVLAAALFFAATTFVILGLTPYTNQLDDIKIPGLYSGGAACLAAWALLWLQRRVPNPPAAVWVPFAAYIGASVVSTLAAADFARWIGWQYVGAHVSTLGFVLLGAAWIQSRRLAEWALKFWVLITLVTTLFGLFHYAGLFEGLRDLLYPGGQPQGQDRLFDLITTFVGGRGMLSTFLNSQFFGNFLLMALPVTTAALIFVYKDLQVAQGLYGGEGDVRWSLVWMILAGLAMVLALTCIFTTFSKASIFLLPVVMLVFGGGAWLLMGRPRIPYVGVLAGCVGVMAASVLYFVWGDLRNQLVDLGDSVGPRRYIFGGAWRMFLDNWALGGGPGSFRLLFPEYRSPDYHLSRISNVTLYAHSWLLDLLAETGLAGTMAYLAFLGGVGWLAWRALRSPADAMLRVAVLGAAVGVASVLAGSLTTPMTRWPVGVVALHSMIGTLVGLSVYTLRFATDLADREAPPGLVPTMAPTNAAQPPVAGVVLAATVLFGVYITLWSVRIFRASYEHNEGMRRTELPAEFFGPTGVAQDQRVIALLGEGEERFQRSLELDPARPTTYYKLAAAQNRLGRPAEALATYEAMRAFAPDYSEVHFNRAILYNELARRGREEGLAEEELVALRREAAAAADRAAELSNKISVVYYHGTTYLALGQELAEDSGESREAFLRAARAFERAAKLPVSTVLQAERQIEREENEKRSSATLAPQAYRQARAFVEAARLAEEAFWRMPASEPRMRQTVSDYLAAENPEAALEFLDEVLAINPLWIEAREERANVLEELDAAAAEREKERAELLEERIAAARRGTRTER